MWRGLGAALALGCLGACLTVPTEQLGPESPRQATATVDHLGKVVQGGNLTITVPPDAVPEGERIQLTIDVIVGAPAGHLSEAYIVGPDGYFFERPITVSYQYKETHITEVFNLNRLFVGVAQGPGWLPLDDHSHDQGSKKVQGTITHLSVFGLVDPDAPVDGGVVLDSAGFDAGSPDLSSGQDAATVEAGRSDSARPDSARPDSSVSPSSLQIQLTWTGASADLDLHLLRIEDAQFTADDCYYANCKTATGLEWPPTGLEGNPVMDIDDLDGYGPENINVAQPANGSYVASVHGYSMHGDPLPMDYTVRVFHAGAQILSTTRSLAVCGDFAHVADIVVSGAGTSVTSTERFDEPFQETSAACF